MSSTQEMSEHMAQVDQSALAEEPKYRGVMILDLDIAQEIWSKREQLGIDQLDEVWEGLYVVSPLANLDHQEIGVELRNAIASCFRPDERVRVFHGCNVSDRDRGWAKNYRIPDVAVFRPDGPGRPCVTHWCGGPDFGVGILSPNDRARDKMDFYTFNGVREFLLIDRDPWALEFYHLIDGRLQLTSVLKVDDASLTSEVVPASFRLIAGEERPRIEVTSTRDASRWTI